MVATNGIETVQSTYLPTEIYTRDAPFLALPRISRPVMPGSGVGVIGTQGSLPRFNPLSLSLSPRFEHARHAIGREEGRFLRASKKGDNGDFSFRFDGFFLNDFV